MARVAGLVAFSVGLVLGATHWPSAVNLARGGPASDVRATPQPVTQTRSVCPGPEVLGVQDGTASRGQPAWVAAVSAPLAALPSGTVIGQGEGSLTTGGLPSGGTWAVPAAARGQAVASQVSTARSALVAATGSMAAGTVATQWSWTTAGSGRGLVTSACVPAAVSSWLVAGGAGPGRLEHLVLANPGANPVVVDLAVLGARGPVDSAGGRGLVVAGHGRTVVLLDALAGAEPSPVVHVSARGGKVAAVLSDAWLDGVVPRGGDDVVSLAAPGREQVVAGVPIDGPAILRLAVPGAGEAVVESRVLTPGGPRPLPAHAVVRVAGGHTRDLDLGSLPPGAYAVQVRGDVPVVAAVMVERRRAAGAPSDLAWSVASPPIRTLAGMVLPAGQVRGLGQRLDLAAAGGSASALVTTVLADGRPSTKEVAIGADSVATLPLGGATSVWVTPLAGVVRAVVLTSAGDAGGALLSLTPLPNLTLTTTPTPLRELQNQPETGSGPGQLPSGS